MLYGISNILYGFEFLCVTCIQEKLSYHTGSRALPGSDSPPVDLSVADIGLQIAAERLEIAQYTCIVTMDWRAYRKPPSLFQIIPSLTPYTIPVTPSPNGVQMRSRINFATRAAT